MAAEPSPGDDLGGLVYEVRVLLREAQQVPEALVLVHGVPPGAGLLLGLGQLYAQRLVLGLELLILEQIAVGAVQPVRHRGGRLADGLAHRDYGVRQKVRLSAHDPPREQRDEQDGDDDDAEPYAVFLQIFLQSSFTPTSASILPSLHKGRPMTLKKSPVMPSTKSEA